MTFWELFFLIAGLLGGLAYSLAFKLPNRMVALFIKTFASIMFVLLGLVCALRRFDTFASIMLLALVLGMLADIVFGYRHVDKARKQLFFKIGVGLFALGHIVYIFAINSLKLVPIWMYLAAVPLALLVCWVPKKFYGAHYGKLGPVLLVYAFILGSMLVCAVYVFACTPNKPNSLMLLFAAILFSISDTILLFESFVKETFAIKLANLMTYYPAQLLFALCIGFLER